MTELSIRPLYFRSPLPKFKGYQNLRELGKLILTTENRWKNHSSSVYSELLLGVYSIE